MSPLLYSLDRQRGLWPLCESSLKSLPSCVAFTKDIERISFSLDLHIDEPTVHRVRVNVVVKFVNQHCLAGLHQLTDDGELRSSSCTAFFIGSDKPDGAAPGHLLPPLSGPESRASLLTFTRKAVCPGCLMGSRSKTRRRQRCNGGAMSFCHGDLLWGPMISCVAYFDRKNLISYIMSPTPPPAPAQCGCPGAPGLRACRWPPAGRRRCRPRGRDRAPSRPRR